MRLAIFAVFLAFNASAWAQTTLIIKPDELLFKCSKTGILDLTVNKLQLHTESKLNQVSIDANQEGICEALKDYFLNQDSLELKVESQVSKQNHLVKDLPCDGYICKSIIKKSLGEKVNVQIKQVRFIGNGVVPGSEKLVTEEWDNRSCPYWDSLCDF